MIAVTSANVNVTDESLIGSGYTIGGTKVFTSAGSAFGNTVFDNGAFLQFQFEGSEYPGTVSGYDSGGNAGPVRLDVINKFPFSADASSSDVGELTAARESVGGASSSAHGYTFGGLNPLITPAPSDIIDKFPFSSDTNATDVGELANASYQLTGLSSPTNAYVGRGTPSPSSTTVQKFPFASDTSATAGATFPDYLTHNGFNSGTGIHKDIGNGYFNHGRPACVVKLLKFSFITDTFQGAVSFGFTPGPVGRYGGGASQSSTHGYYSGGKIPGSTNSNQIEKFPFAAEDTVSDVGDLFQARSRVAAQSSTVCGYTTGGYTGPPGTSMVNTIDKFSFATDGNATDVGELLCVTRSSVGAQV